LKATALKRGSLNVISKHKEILSSIASDEVMLKRWNGYKNSYSYSAGIGFEETVDVVNDMLALIQDL
jgi:hypothetical protein